jgi:hypothetical protein
VTQAATEAVGKQSGVMDSARQMIDKAAGSIDTLNRTQPDINTSRVEKATDKFEDLADAAEEARREMARIGVKQASDNVKKGVDFVLDFASGGIVPGPVGSPHPAIVHGGEMVLTRDQQRAVFSGGRSDGAVLNLTVNNYAPIFGTSDVQRFFLDTIGDLARTRRLHLPETVIESSR